MNIFKVWTVFFFKGEYLSLVVSYLKITENIQTFRQKMGLKILYNANVHLAKLV